MTAEDYLRRARNLAETARGRTSPNPVVGCLIVRDDMVVGEGCHAAVGQPHAERIALEAAGERARGATLYCTLEPCCHHGRTPPCTEAIIAAGVARVVCSLLDSDPRASGHGVEALRRSGLEVTVGPLAEEVSWQLRAYLHHRHTGRPWVTGKWAMTLDGKLATASGDSRWVSGEAARAVVHRLRDRVDAVMVGSRTVAADDPSLTCRLAEFEPVGRPTRHPLRVVVDTQGATPRRATVYTDGLAPTVLAVGEGREVQSRPGVELLRLPERRGHVDLTALLIELGRRGVVELLCEGGGGLSGALLRAGLVNEVLAFVAPKLIGGDGPTAWSGPGRDKMSAAVRLSKVSVEPVGDDWLVHGLVEGAA